MKSYLLIVGLVLSFFLIGCLGEDPASINNDIESSVDESSSSINESSSSEIENSSEEDQSSSDYNSSPSSESSSYKPDEASSEPGSSDHEQSSTEKNSSSNSSSSEQSSSSESTPVAQTPEEDDLEGSWKFAAYIGGGPQERVVDLNDDASAAYSVKILGAERNTAEGTWEIDGNSIKLTWTQCASSGDDTDCSGDDASGIPIEFEWDGTKMYSLDDQDNKYEKQ